MGAGEGVSNHVADMFLCLVWGGVCCPLFWGLLNRACSVLSIEANPKIYQTLCINVELNDLKDTIKPISAILGSTDGVACQSHFNGNGNAGGSIVEFGRGAEFSCTVDTIYKDYGDMRRVSLLKIDCEGVDFEVLKGARNLLETFKHIVMVEVFPTDIALQRGIRTQLGDYFLFLHELGYKLVWNDAAFNYIFKHS